MAPFVRAVLVVIVAMAAAAPPATAGNLTWGAFADVERVDPVNADGNTISCPTLDLCVAGLDAGQLGVSVNPTATPPTWSIFTLPVTTTGSFTTDFAQVRCTSATACVAVSDAGDVFTSNDPVTEASWTKSSLGEGEFYARSFESLSCPSFCLGFDLSNGDVMRADGPLTAGGSYTAGDLPSGFDEVSCQASGLCIATDGFYGIWHSGQPAGGADKWSQTGNVAIIPDGETTRENIYSAYCAPTFCLAGSQGKIGHKGALYWSTNPGSDDANDWHATPELISEIDGLTCSPDGGRCAAWRDDAAFVFDSASPLGDASAWAGKNVTPTDYVAEVSCPTVSTCFAMSLSSDFNMGVDTGSPDPTATPGPSPSPSPSPDPGSGTPTPSPTPGPPFVAPTASPTPTPSGIFDSPFSGPKASDPPSTFRGSSIPLNISSPFDANVTVRMVAGQPTHIDGFFRAVAAKLVTYGKGKAAVKANVAKKVKVKLTKAAKKAFRKRRKAKVTFLVTATPTAGGAARTTSVKATIKRKK